MALPKNLIADTMNARLRRAVRGHRHDRVPCFHASSIIKTSKSDFFCPREQVLRHMERRQAEGGSIPPKQQLLFAAGSFYGEYIVAEFMRRNPRYAKYVWGDWTCACGHTVVEKSLPVDQTCKRCSGKVNIYKETDLFNPQRTVIGHADLIFLYQNVFYPYEFKSIDRADTPFEDLTEPLPEHVMQLSLYFYMLQHLAKSMKSKPRVSTNIRFVYIDRSMTEMYKAPPFKEFQSKPIKKERLQRLMKKVALVHTSVKNGTLPTRKCEDITQYRAKSCGTAISCFERRGGRIRRVAASASTPQSRPSASTGQKSGKKAKAVRSRPRRKTAATPDV